MRGIIIETPGGNRTPVPLESGKNYLHISDDGTPSFTNVFEGTFTQPLPAKIDAPGALDEVRTKNLTRGVIAFVLDAEGLTIWSYEVDPDYPTPENVLGGVIIPNDASIDNNGRWIQRM